MLIPALLLTLAVVQNPADIQKGKQLFEGLCSRCHGFDGAGGEGPSLNRPLMRAQNDDAFRAIIRDGIPDRGMPRVRRTTDNEQNQLIAYVRSLGRTAPSARTGDPQKGSEVYQKSGCASCHVVKGEGGTTGPELTVIGTIRGPDHLRQAVLDPGNALPRGVQQVTVGRNLDEYLPVRVVTNQGREIRGVRVNEDSFTIQIRDANNQFHSLRKSDLKQIEKEFGKSAMPSFKEKLSAAEVADLVAYLSSLGGAK